MIHRLDTDDVGAERWMVRAHITVKRNLRETRPDDQHLGDVADETGDLVEEQRIVVDTTGSRPPWIGLPPAR